MKKAPRKPINQIVRTSCASLAKVTPLTDNQRVAFEAFGARPNLFLRGTPRTGKTFLALYLALSEIESGRREKLYVIRSAVPSRDMGHLPGSAEEKMAPYERPYTGIIGELYHNPAALHNLRTNGTYEFMSTSHLRGKTLRDCVVIMDEVQNMSFQEIHTIITRLGKQSRVIVCGDYGQCDFGHDKLSGYLMAAKAFEVMESFSTVTFTKDDIVGSPIIKEWLIATGQA